MTVMSDREKQRRLLLEWMSASPLLALPGVPWAQDAAKRPDPMIWPATIAHEAIASPKDAINVFDFEPVAYKKVPPAHFGYMALGIDDEVTPGASASCHPCPHRRP